jgi:hypothetical protein
VIRIALAFDQQKLLVVRDAHIGDSIVVGILLVIGKQIAKKVAVAIEIDWRFLGNLPQVPTSTNRLRGVV